MLQLDHKAPFTMEDPLVFTGSWLFRKALSQLVQAPEAQELEKNEVV